jgi:alpha-1,6-mannosyltransferase
MMLHAHRHPRCAPGSIRGSQYLGGVLRIPARPLRPVGLRLAGTGGFVGALCILLGTAQGGSPFVLKLPGAWFFGTSSTVAPPSSGGAVTFLGVMLVYAGVAIMVASWLELVRTVRRHPGTSLARVVWIMVAWTVPVLFMPPLFSRDVYSYAAQGEMVSRGVSPYLHGPNVLGPNRFLALVDPLWKRARAPYGPGWERLSGAVVHLARHDVLAAIVGFRVVALCGVALMAWGIPVLARSVGRDQGAALALAVLNPLVLLVLLGGAHNDALMLGLLVAGCALARRHHPLLGVALCALAAEVKIPALIGAAFIGWWCSDGATAWRQRIPRVAVALAVAVGVLAGVSAVAGLGWRWLSGLSSPGVVVSWLDPATAVGLTVGHLATLVGLGHHSGAIVQACRALGLGLAAVISAALIVRSDRVGAIRALGLSLLVFVVLGPVVWPWYEAWGIVFLAVVAEGWTLRIVLGLSAVACFADVPGLRVLGANDPVLTSAGWTCLLVAVIAFAVVRLLPSLPRPSGSGSTTLHSVFAAEATPE